MGVDNKATKEGVVYYRQLAVPPPRLYDYHQPLVDDRWIVGYDGTRIKVRERNDDGTWRITANGVGTSATTESNTLRICRSAGIGVVCSALQLNTCRCK